MSKAEISRDTVAIESSFRKFKNVLHSQYHYWNWDDILKVVDQAVFYFNYIKPVRRLNKKIPVQYRIELAA